MNYKWKTESIELLIEDCILDYKWRTESIELFSNRGLKFAMNLEIRTSFKISCRTYRCGLFTLPKASISVFPDDRKQRDSTCNLKKLYRKKIVLAK